MSVCKATVRWLREEQDFLDNEYSRGHEWAFDGGVVVPASSSPDIVPVPQSVAANVDPEEAFIASLSSCHMLFFLNLACNRKLVIDSYTDDAEGIMGKNEDGRLAMLEVTLRPRVVFGGDTEPDPDLVDRLHHRAHGLCIIANSVLTEVKVEPV